MTDEELLTEYLRTKDNGLFTALYERMHDGLCAVARRIAPKDADDVVQDAFCKLCRLEPQEVNPGFMVKMVQNLAICRSRCRKQKREVSLDVVMRLGLGDEYGRNGPIDEADSTETRLEKNESWDEIASAIASLPSKQKEAIELHYRHRRTIAEAAEIMEADFDAVQNWIRRGRDRLREVLVIENDGHIEVQRLRYLLESMYAIAG